MYKKEKNKIIIEDLSQFNIEHILECGQIFRFTKTNGDYILYSLDKKAVIKTYDKKTEILTDDINYFVNFFDLKTDYNTQKKQLFKYDFLKQAADFGYGIRILKQDLFETLVSFIISANNNIKRITQSVFKLSEMFGRKVKDYYAFPTLSQLKKATVADFLAAGLGYRAEQLHKTIQMLDKSQLISFFGLNLKDKKSWLESLHGVGEKVADCVLLFAGEETEIFPVDTWINKVYNNHFNTIESNRKHIREVFVNMFGNLSGLAQQYLFYYLRTIKKW